MELPRRHASDEGCLPYRESFWGVAFVVGLEFAAHLDCRAPRGLLHLAQSQLVGPKANDPRLFIMGPRTVAYRRVSDVRFVLADSTDQRNTF